MRIQPIRRLSRAPSIVLALASSSSWTTSAFIPSSVSALRTAPVAGGIYSTTSSSASTTSFTTTSTCSGNRGGSALNASEGSVNGEASDSDKSKPKPSSRQPSNTGDRPSTGWTHNKPDPSSSFWEGKKELPKNTAPESYTSNTNTNSKERPKTGWLHNSSKVKAAAKNNSNSSNGQTKKSTGNTARRMLEQAMLDSKRNHRIISPPTFHAVAEGRRAVVTEHKLAVPFDRTKSPTDPKAPEPMLDVYFTIVELVTTPEQESFFQRLQQQSSGASSKVRQREMAKRASDYKAFAKLMDAKECILYLQGGPGFGAPKPIDGIGLSDTSSWVGAALSKGYKKIILMDQRGTGRSSTITKQTLEKQFPDLFLLDEDVDTVVESVSSMASVEEELSNMSNNKSGVEVEAEVVDKVKSALVEATEYMAQFRADNIVMDAESIREALLVPLDIEEGEQAPPRPWGAALGQSFGGFCMMTYLSLIPNPPMICLLTGGIAPMCTNVDDVYISLRERVRERNLMYYDRYPGDVDVVKRIVSRLDKDPPKLPSGGILTARRFLQLGIGLGGSPSAFASLHTLLSSAFISDEDDDDDMSRAFLKAMDSTQPFDDHPIYFLMHESIYADMTSGCEKTSWSAHRAYAPDDSFDFKASCESNEPTLLTGEVVFPWMADGDYAELSGFGMRALAQYLADKGDWGQLYNTEQMKKALAVDGSGVSKAAAAVYYGDMYVDFDAVMEVTKRGNPLENCKVWISNEYQHSGLRDDGAMIFNKLLGMVKGEVGTPS